MSANRKDYNFKATEAESRYHDYKRPSTKFSLKPARSRTNFDAEDSSSSRQPDLQRDLFERQRLAHDRNRSDSKYRNRNQSTGLTRTSIFNDTEDHEEQESEMFDQRHSRNDRQRSRDQSDRNASDVRTEGDDFRRPYTSNMDRKRSSKHQPRSPEHDRYASRTSERDDSRDRRSSLTEDKYHDGKTYSAEHAQGRKRTYDEYSPPSKYARKHDNAPTFREGRSRSPREPDSSRHFTDRREVSPAHRYPSHAHNNRTRRVNRNPSPVSNRTTDERRPDASSARHDRYPREHSSPRRRSPSPSKDLERDHFRRRSQDSACFRQGYDRDSNDSYRRSEEYSQHRRRRSRSISIDRHASSTRNSLSASTSHLSERRQVPLASRTSRVDTGRSRSRSSDRFHKLAASPERANPSRLRTSRQPESTFHNSHDRRFTQNMPGEWQSGRARTTPEHDYDRTERRAIDIESSQRPTDRNGPGSRPFRSYQDADARGSIRAPKYNSSKDYRSERFEQTNPISQSARSSRYTRQHSYDDFDGQESHRGRSIDRASRRRSPEPAHPAVDEVVDASRVHVARDVPRHGGSAGSKLPARKLDSGSSVRLSPESTRRELDFESQDQETRPTSYSKSYEAAEPVARSRGQLIQTPESLPTPQSARNTEPNILNRPMDSATTASKHQTPVENKSVAPQPSSTNVSIYERIGQVGEGTYGKVYKARHTKTNELVALKRIRMEQERDGFPITSVREIRLLQRLRHPGVVKLLEMMIEKGSVYMVFEYMDHDLTGVLANQSITFDLPHIKDLSHQLFEGLAYLHHRGVLHRDIKGSNILLNNAGELKLADFGLARFYQKSKQTADYTNRVITLWFRPPELLLGATAYDAAVDIWSAGCILIELFTRSTIFPGRDEIHQLETIYQVMGSPTEESWPRVSQLPWYELIKFQSFPGTFATDFADVLSSGAFDLSKRILNLDPAQRPTAAEILDHEFFLSEAPKAERRTLFDISESHEWDTKQRRRDERAKKAKEEKGREKAQEVEQPVDRL